MIDTYFWHAIKVNIFQSGALLECTYISGGFVSRRLFCKRIGTRIFLPEEGGYLPKELIDIVTFRWTFYQHINDKVCFGGEISTIEKKAKLQFQQSDKVDCKQKTQCNSLFRNVTFGGLWLH